MSDFYQCGGRSFSSRLICFYSDWIEKLKDAKSKVCVYVLCIHAYVYIRVCRLRT